MHEIRQLMPEIGILHEMMQFMPEIGILHEMMQFMPEKSMILCLKLGIRPNRQVA
jgi:hypothetical protein